ncbi:hypothetical protein ACFVYA_04410 [Amycolatopsis sp. NPDC058278]|uniref:hypothetical protein n=1 Tax=unclassified Amycolatopsis TaxID=2618356 RepID=UPI00255BA479|nr:hypothetical protein [Amycolatopsis sp. DG1A-15b]WIX87987.1 hypothetical protein QRY02_43795 [Amycolatopsis sp. DG1A-15b]
MRTARIASALLMGVAVLAYSGWLLEFFLPTGVSPVRDPAEALLTGPPVFRVLLAVAGVAFALAGPPLHRLGPVQWSARLSSISVSAFGVLVLLQALYPEHSDLLSSLLSVVLVAGVISLILWWPPGWRALAVVGLVLVLATWLAVVLARQLDGYEGVFTRAQLVVRAALYGIGGAYAFVKPAPRHAHR